MTTNRKQCLLLLLLFPLLILIIVEAIQRFGIFSTLIWIYNYPVIVFINYFLILSVVIFLSSLLASWRLGNMVSALMLWMLGLVCSYKQFFLNEPLFPWDITMYRYALELIPLLANQTGLWAMILIILLCFLLFFLLYPLQNLNLGYRLRLGVAIPSMLVLASILLFNSSPAKQLLSELNIENMYWIQNENYKQNGFVLSFMMNFQSAVVLPPDGYSIQAVKSMGLTQENSILTNSSEVVREGEDTESGVKPNVIMIMSEAFWDPTIIQSISFSEDPLQKFKTLQNNYPDAKLLSPVFGGMTANVEFEVLTGLSTALLPQGSIPYQQYIRSDLPGLPSIFKAKGYHTLAIHPYHEWFYRRNEVYPLLGFERFEGLEEFENPVVKGQFVSDMEVTKKIINTINETEAPIFLYAITMQNHGPYEANRYKSTSVKIKGQLSTDSMNMLKTYTQGVRDADTALGALIEQLRQQSEPTIVVFFGDHLPLLGKEYKLYKESGFINEQNQSDWTLAEIMKMREVPLVMWSNFTLKHGDLGIISPFMLGPILLEDANIPIPEHYALVKSISEVVPGFSSDLFVDSKGVLYGTIPIEAEEMIHQYQIIQYNLLFDH